ncbi:MAG: DNA polymerase III subunit delta' [Lachnospiraceae bacterium]|nr:DNA polymerase III subunit delta' [Lachnospiraceae bacterium]
MQDMGFNSVIGHEDIIHHFRAALTTGKISHAYILAGDKGSGKKMLAGIFAAALQCEDRESDPCYQCESCRKAQHQNHPDIIRLVHDKPATISVDDIREQVVAAAALKPFESRYKIFIIGDAEKMTPQAQNALLKTIEEPPAYAVFLLLTQSLEALLPTIVSRCVTLNLKPLPDRKIAEYLMAVHHIPAYDAEIAAAFSQGSIGRAREVVLEENYMVKTEETINLLRRINKWTMKEMVDYLKTITSEKLNIQDYLDILRLWFRDVLMFKATKEIDNLIFKKEMKDIREQAVKCSYEGLEDILRSITRAEERLRANVSFELTVELLLLSVRENMNG